MSASGLEGEEDLFHACAGLGEGERVAYLDRACVGNPELRRRVERLLAASSRADAATLQPLAVLSLAAIPDQIGPYHVLRMLGDGGMGIVYEAEQLHPVQRRVALKIVKLGMDTRQVVARFMAERQSLAAMDHPYVAKVFDAGETDTGRPYFVMEVVRGEPLVRYCDRNGLSVRERIALFIQICQAVQHAHHKGVIHRDLKPSNVLVSMGDTGPVPKIIDFGIAKAVSQDDVVSAAEITRAGQALGTPAYMSPEQASRGKVDIDTRTDVYSLGVILYELLAGALPTDPATTGEEEFLVLLARGELDPPRPSVRGRAIERRIPADVDWIVMKALAVDRGERYETPLSLADDLGRYLDDQPVSARPPSLAYRAGKYVRRHRLQAAAVAVALLAVAAGALAAGIGLVRANRAEAVANREATTARRVSAFLTELFGASDPNARSSTTLRELLERGVKRIDADLKDEPQVQASLLSTFGHVYGSLGLHRDAIELSKKSLALDAARGSETLQTAETCMTVGRSSQTLGLFEQAGDAFNRALAIRTRLLGANHLDVAAVLNSIGGLEGQLEHYDEAIAAHTRALGIQERLRGPDHLAITNSLRGLGTLYSRKGDVKKGIELQRRALAIYRKTFGEQHPITAAGYEALAFDLTDLHEFEQARDMAQRAVEIRRNTVGPDHPDTAFAHAALGQALMAQGELDAALVPLREALRIREAALGANHPRTADALTTLGLLMLRRKDVDVARPMLERALGIYQKAYGPNHSKTLKGQQNVAMAREQG